MKRTILALSFLFATAAQADNQWSKYLSLTYGGFSNLDSDGFMMTTGEGRAPLPSMQQDTNHRRHPIYDFTSKIDENGEVSWLKSFEQSSYYQGMDIVESGGIYYLALSSHHNLDSQLLLISKDGVEIDRVTSENAEYRSLESDGADGVIITGQYPSEGNGFVAHYSASGEMQTCTIEVGEGVTLNSSAYQDGIAISVGHSDSRGVIYATSFSAGECYSELVYEEPAASNGFTDIIISQSQLYVAHDSFVTKLDEDYNMIWSINYEGNIINGLSQGSQNNILAAGMKNGDSWLLTFDTDGVIGIDETYAYDEFDDYANSVLERPSGDGYMLTGKFSDNSFFLSVDENGYIEDLAPEDITPTGVSR
ncbi:hypothetical protein [Vibrio coralliilyticus]|uniref:hypothetical protein n=1 Tax=Vibrio coralliilyticus TaxID=190893 RepID=UPI0006CD9A4B|nr:hypothetical protein [Vibrio coralliilyticus]AXN30779.1 hypothetical protein DVV14_05400 [Vibrio coralliilyticus]KPH27163.1 hypothetical protein ADU60_02555 [Vibrio coralliilyticus]